MKSLKLKIWDRDQKKFIDCISDFSNLFVKQDNVFELLNPKIESDVQHRYDICIYTGINDDFDGEIYDGDIILFKSKKGSNIMAVRYSSKEAKFRLVTIGYDPDKEVNFIKVIGNIYENPELFESKNEEEAISTD